MKTRIRFLINTLSGGGAEKVLVDLLCHPDLDSYDIELVTVTGGVHENKIPDNVKYRKIIKTKNKKLEKFLSKIVFKMPRGLFSHLFLKGTRDIEIAYLEGLPTRFVAAKKHSSHKLAFVHCDLSVDNIISPFYKNKTECKDEYDSFDLVCFVSEKARSGFDSVYGSLSNGTVVHNVIDTRKILDRSAATTEEHYNTSGTKLITVGRLSKEKGFDRLIRIAAKLEKKYDFELWIVGDGDEKQNLETLIRDNNVKSVKLLGFRDNPYPLVRQADLFVCSSFFEGYSTAVTESVILGVPVITTACAGMEEILEKGLYGIITDNSEDGLMAVMDDLLANSSRIDKIKNSIMENKDKIMSYGSAGEYIRTFDLLLNKSKQGDN